MGTVTYNGLWLHMSESALVELGWTSGQTITETQVPEAIKAKARAFCREMDRRRSNDGSGITDTTKLAALCGHQNN